MSISLHGTGIDKNMGENADEEFWTNLCYLVLSNSTCAWSYLPKFFGYCYQYDDASFDKDHFLQYFYA